MLPRKLIGGRPRSNERLGASKMCGFDIWLVAACFGSNGFGRRARPIMAGGFNAGGMVLVCREMHVRRLLHARIFALACSRFFCEF